MDPFEKQLKRMQEGQGFIAALDQSGGSTPKALLSYGIKENEYNSDEAMYELIHTMRARVITNESFSGDKILGVILFEKTLNNKIEGLPTSEYLWNKNIVSFLKIDKGLEERVFEMQLMKTIPHLDEIIQDAKKKGVFGTKMRSVIYGYNRDSITKIVQQQFNYARVIIENGLIPIIEPEVDIHAHNKKEIEMTLKEEIQHQLGFLNANQYVMLKLTLPTENNFYHELTQHPQVLRVEALSGGYDIDIATEKLTQNKGVIASFSRALLDDLRVNQSDAEFTKTLSTAINRIYMASIT